MTGENPSTGPSSGVLREIWWMPLVLAAVALAAFALRETGDALCRAGIWDARSQWCIVAAAENAAEE